MEERCAHMIKNFKQHQPLPVWKPEGRKDVFASQSCEAVPSLIPAVVGTFARCNGVVTQIISLNLPATELHVTEVFTTPF